MTIFFKDGTSVEYVGVTGSFEHDGHLVLVSAPGVTVADLELSDVDTEKMAVTA